MAYLGTHSGRKENKVASSGLTPISIDGNVSFKESNLVFTCRKVYQHQLEKDGISNDIQEYYKKNPLAYPRNENGDWEPHWMIIGEITNVKDTRNEPSITSIEKVL